MDGTNEEALAEAEDDWDYFQDPVFFKLNIVSKQFWITTILRRYDSREAIYK